MTKEKRCTFLIKIIYIVFSFGMIDIWLRVLTRWLGLYSIYELPPNLFTLFWSLILTCIVLLIPNKLVKKLVYGVLYFLCGIYAIVQYGYYLIFGKFLYFSDFLFAGEGGEFSSYILEILNAKVIMQMILLLIIGIIGIILLPKESINNKKIKFVPVIVLFLSVLGICFVPCLYEENNTDSFWITFSNPRIEYDRFVNSGFDMELTGIYQYIARDTMINIEKKRNRVEVDVEAIEEIDTYFEEKQVSLSNDMSGIFADKNVIIFMMESIDDWLVTEEDMPTLYYMMENGINFTNMYTPAYSSGYTFNTEFSFNTSVYPFSNGNVAYTLSTNEYRNSISNLFKQNGYKVNSFHYNSSNFYNRSAMHDAWGYEKYHSYQDYEYNDVCVGDDTYLYLCDELYSDVTEGDKFMSFVITGSAHLSYTLDNEMSQYALEKYPEYAQGEITEEDIIHAKARMTDDMFAGLLERLEEDGLLEDTVIVGYSDHYAYGISDEEFLQRVSEEAGNSILENTPAFIYCAGMEDLAMEVDKVMQITDLAPTIENMFGFDVPKEIMGSDVFDECYSGYAIFPNNTWITNEAYVKNGAVVYNNGMTEEEILEMNQFAQKTYVVNDYILECDYYSRVEE